MIDIGMQILHGDFFVLKEYFKFFLNKMIETVEII